MIPSALSLVFTKLSSSAQLLLVRPLFLLLLKFHLIFAGFILSNKRDLFIETRKIKKDHGIIFMCKKHQLSQKKTQWEWKLSILHCEKNNVIDYIETYFIMKCVHYHKYIATTIFNVSEHQALKEEFFFGTYICKNFTFFLQTITFVRTSNRKINRQLKNIRKIFLQKKYFQAKTPSLVAKILVEPRM